MTTRVGVREFRDKATRYLAGDEVLAIERHGALVGYFVPVGRRDTGAMVDRAVERLRAEIADDPRQRRDEILEVCRRHGAGDVRLFGSFARGDQRPDSDVDLLVTFEPGRSLLDLAALTDELSGLLGRAVDVITESAAKAPVLARALSEAVDL